MEFCRKRQFKNKANEQNDEGKTKDTSDQSKIKNIKQNDHNVKAICLNQIHSTDRKFIDIEINNQPIQLQIDSAAISPSFHENLAENWI